MAKTDAMVKTAAIYGGKCPRCQSVALVEARVRSHYGTDIKDSNGPTIKTICGACGAFIGKRPFDSRLAGKGWFDGKAKAKDQDASLPDVQE